MKIIGENSGTREYVADAYSIYYMNTLIVTTKGWDREFFHVLKTNIIMNLSKNRFEGHIPSIIADLLVGLCTLNLSHNGLEGIMPASLQHLSILESLDLSSNKIGGEIPQVVSLPFLAVLNLSHNHLVGCIPKGKHFDTFENSSYQGNDGFHGWQAVLMVFGCGIVIGLSIIYIMLSTHYLVWFSRMVVKFEHRIVTRMKRHKN
ncbi:hypothetical protein P3S67_000376 [Capsicum chacoense]